MKRLIYIIVTVTIVITLIGCGTDDDISYEIYNAIVNGEYQTVEELLKNNDIDLENYRAVYEATGDSRVLAASVTQQPEDTEMCRLLVECGADINSRSPYGATYLHEIIDCSEAVPSADYTEIMKLLLKSGEDVNAKGRKSYTETPLDYLMTKSTIITIGYDEMFNILLDNGTEVTKNTMECCIGCRSYEKVCPQTIRISEELKKFAEKMGR